MKINKRFLDWQSFLMESFYSTMMGEHFLKIREMLFPLFFTGRIYAQWLQHYEMCGTISRVKKEK